MVGGKVIETVELSDRIWVNCEDNGQQCAVYVRKNAKARCISEGDSVWWQAGTVYWTPPLPSIKGEMRHPGHCDIQLEKLGYSGADKPTIENLAKHALWVMEDDFYEIEDGGSRRIGSHEWANLRRLLSEIRDLAKPSSKTNVV